MIDFPFEKCKRCTNPVRLVDIHGKTIGRRCYYQLDTMKEWWDKDDCDHFFEPKNAKTSELGDALQHSKAKRTQCPDEELWFPCCRTCMDWYDKYQDEGVNQESSCYCISHHSEMNTRRLVGETDCPYKMPY